jgi:hypothetical protein
MICTVYCKGRGSRKRARQDEQTIYIGRTKYGTETRRERKDGSKQSSEDCNRASEMVGPTDCPTTTKDPVFDSN